MGTDFFDHDLHSERRVPPVAADDSEPGPDTISAHAISRLVVQKHERTNQMAGAAQEIELLRLRQRELEKEKEALENLTNKQETYEKTKQDVLEALERSLVMFDKQAAEAMRAADLIATVRKRFEESLQEIRGIDENGWVGQGFDGELTKALAVVEQAQAQYKKGMSKVTASSWFRASESAALEAAEPAVAGLAGQQGFGAWLKAGVAFSLPIVVVIIGCFVAWVLMAGGKP